MGCRDGGALWVSNIPGDAVITRSAVQNIQQNCLLAGTDPAVLVQEL